MSRAVLSGEPVDHPGSTVRDAGEALVGFLGAVLALMAGLLVIAQMAVWVWARNVAVTAVAEGARLGAEAGRSPGEGVERVRMVLRAGLGAPGDRFTVEGGRLSRSVVMRARGRAPAVFPALPTLQVEVSAEALAEDEAVP